VKSVLLLQSILSILLFTIITYKSGKAIPTRDSIIVPTTQSDSLYRFAKANDEIRINGKIDGAEWADAEWRIMDQAWIGGSYDEDDFSGRYKVLWDEDRLYVLAEIKDDTLVDTHADGLVQYWDDDCLEVFIDADASGGNHQYNYNAFAYHIALDLKVTDIGIDSIPHYYQHIESVRSQDGNTSLWELAISLYDDNYVLDDKTTPIRLTEGHLMGFAIAYCDNDYSEEREHFIGSIPVDGEDKNRGWIDAGIFEKVILK
jgi:hypothetical protein